MVMAGIINGMMKACSSCGITLPPNNFYRNKSESDGLQRACKICQRDQRRASRRRAAEPSKPAPPVDLPGEQWRAVVGYEGLYSVSCLGRVRSENRLVDKADGTTQLVHARILAPVADRNGYLHVNLFRNNIGATGYIHQLVLAAFVGPQPDGLVVRHLNGKSSDNRLENLQFGTTSENHFDAVRHGTHRNAHKTHCPSGHEYTDENTFRFKNGRYCKKCRAGERTNPAWKRRASI